MGVLWKRVFMLPTPLKKCKRLMLHTWRIPPGDDDKEDYRKIQFVLEFVFFLLLLVRERECHACICGNSGEVRRANRHTRLFPPPFMEEIQRQTKKMLCLNGHRYSHHHFMKEPLSLLQSDAFTFNATGKLDFFVCIPGKNRTTFILNYLEHFELFAGKEVKTFEMLGSIRTCKNPESVKERKEVEEKRKEGRLALQLGCESHESRVVHFCFSNFLARRAHTLATPTWVAPKASISQKEK